MCRGGGGPVDFPDHDICGGPAAQQRHAVASREGLYLLITSLCVVEGIGLPGSDNNRNIYIAVIIAATGADLSGWWEEGGDILGTHVRVSTKICLEYFAFAKFAIRQSVKAALVSLPLI